MIASLPMVLLLTVFSLVESFVVYVYINFQTLSYFIILVSKMIAHPIHIKHKVVSGKDAKKSSGSCIMLTKKLL